MDYPVQTRSQDGELEYFSTLKKAMDMAERDESIWKISFALGEERVRLVRHYKPTERVGIFGTMWVYESITDEIEKALKT